MKDKVKRTWLIAECILLFAVFPVLACLFLPPPTWLITLAFAALGTIIWLARKGHLHRSDFWRGPSIEQERKTLKHILYRAAAGSLLLIVITIVWIPERLFFLPKHRPVLWIMIGCLYPLLSVYPQEVVYRAYFFKRYASLFPRAKVMLVLNALAFSWVHVIFQNIPALVLSLASGWLFATTYQRSQSLRLVCLEHAIYGFMIFTVGLGIFFYHGAVR